MESHMGNLALFFIVVVSANPNPVTKAKPVPVLTTEQIEDALDGRACDTIKTADDVARLMKTREPIFSQIGASARQNGKRLMADPDLRKLNQKNREDIGLKIKSLFAKGADASDGLFRNWRDLSVKTASGETSLADATLLCRDYDRIELGFFVAQLRYVEEFGGIITKAKMFEDLAQDTTNKRGILKSLTGASPPVHGADPQPPPRLRD